MRSVVNLSGFCRTVDEIPVHRYNRPYDGPVFRAPRHSSGTTGAYLERCPPNRRRTPSRPPPADSPRPPSRITNVRLLFLKRLRVSTRRARSETEKRPQSGGVRTGRLLGEAPRIPPSTIDLTEQAPVLPKCRRQAPTLHEATAGSGVGWGYSVVFGGFRALQRTRTVGCTDVPVFRRPVRRNPELIDNRPYHR